MEGPIRQNESTDDHDGGNEQQEEDCKFSETACFVSVAHERSLPPASIRAGRDPSGIWPELMARTV